MAKKISSAYSVNRNIDSKRTAQKCLLLGVGFTWLTLMSWYATHSFGVVGACISTGIQLWIYVRTFE